MNGFVVLLREGQNVKYVTDLRDLCLEEQDYEKVTDNLAQWAMFVQRPGISIQVNDNFLQLIEVKTVNPTIYGTKF